MYIEVHLHVQSHESLFEVWFVDISVSHTHNSVLRCVASLLLGVYIRVCTRISVYLYECVHTHTCVFVCNALPAWICIFRYTSTYNTHRPLYTSRYASFFTHVLHTYAPFFTHLFLYTSFSLLICFFTHLFLSLHICIFFYTCVFLNISFFTDLLLYTSVSFVTHLHLSLHICVFTHLHL